MLRNCIAGVYTLSLLSVLNEVLSLNAQELSQLWDSVTQTLILNEVLSLNAQESFSGTMTYILA